MAHTEDVIGVAEAAQILHMSVRAVHRRIRSGELPAAKLAGRTGSYVINRADIEALLTASLSEVPA